MRGSARYNALEVESMTVTIRAHYDGKVIVPDEPVELPVNQPLHVELKLRRDADELPVSELSIEERLRRLARFAGRLTGPTIPDEALRRENLYEERV
jgi:hypothetical protein